MAAFSLTSDRQFVAGLQDDPDLYVYEFLADLNDVNIIRPYQPWSTDGVRIGPSHHATFTALQVFGVVISDNLFAELVKDLNLAGQNGQTFRLVVNRRGCCLIDKVHHSSIVMLRINDYFGWSKYGVRLPKVVASDNVWNRCDIYSGATVVDVRGIMVELECTKEMVKKKKSGNGEAAGSLWDRFVEEKEKEVERIVKLHEKEVKRGMEVELLLKKSVEEKEKEVERMRNLLLAERKQVACLKAALNAFVDD